MTVEIGKPNFPAHIYDTMHVGHPITADSFKIAAPKGKDVVKTRVIEIIPNRVGNYERIMELKAKDGYLEADPGQDLLKMAVFERHHETGTKGVGFLKGFGFKKGAMAIQFNDPLLQPGTVHKHIAIPFRTHLHSIRSPCTFTRLPSGH